jgi:hypothetical protein
VPAVAGLDPEPDILRRARRAAADADVTNVSWLLGADTDLPALAGPARGDVGRGRAAVGLARGMTLK